MNKLRSKTCVIILMAVSLSEHPPPCLCQHESRCRVDAPLYRVPGPVGNLAKGIAGVMSEVGTIQKTGYNKFHNYAYAHSKTCSSRSLR